VFRSLRAFRLYRLLRRLVRSLDAIADSHRRIADSLATLVAAQQTPSQPRPKPQPMVFGELSISEASLEWERRRAVEAVGIDPDYGRDERAGRSGRGPVA